ncbi:hypothetical protein HAX54_025632 [Datura stramonium]|uniref:Uncharacterized protein n=1 Tax=Datura stramonium TaxID=4076 RepID=A0ABS8V1E8_DATST|nr:hypothetical protein [Datura stramonium]
MERKIEIVSMELIKPLSPTPNNLRFYEYSYLDQMAIPVFALFILLIEMMVMDHIPMRKQEFVAAAKFLPPPIPYVSNKSKLQIEFINFFSNEQRASKLFAFDASTIAVLKAMPFSNDVQVPTGVEVVSAVIWKCVTATSGNVPTTYKGENGSSDFPTLVTCMRRKSLSELSFKYADKQNRDEGIFAIHNDYCLFGAS